MNQNDHVTSIVRLQGREAGWDHVSSTRRSATATVSQLLSSPPGLELTSSCTAALEAAATVLGIGPGDEVIVPAFSFPSTANAFLLRGATVRFADADLRTGNVDADSIDRCRSEATRAVVCVHYGGVACEMEAITELCDSSGWHLVEDAAHGLFGSYQGLPLGRFGRLAALSFHRTKNISSIDGGAIVVNDPSLVDQVHIALDKGTNRAAFEAGLVSSYEWSGPGSAGRMSDPIVDRLVEQLDLRVSIQRRRHEVWSDYARGLVSWAEKYDVGLPLVPSGAQHPAHLFWMLLPAEVARERFISWCSDHGVEVARHYGSLPDSAFGTRIANPDDRCPSAARLATHLVRLPLHHELTGTQIEQVLAAVTSFDPHAD